MSAIQLAVSTPPQLAQISVSVPTVEPEAILVKYQTLPGNTPKSNNNFLAIWESTIIPWRTQPIATQKVTGDSEDGSVAFGGLAIQSKPYIIGYAVGGDISNICATATIYVGGQSGTNQFSASIGISALSDDALIIDYTCCAGYQPGANKNWVGLWQGQASPYFDGTPLYRTPVTGNGNQGNVVLNDLTLSFNTDYTLAYFVGGDVTDAAAILTFTTSGS